MWECEFVVICGIIILITYAMKRKRVVTTRQNLVYKLVEDITPLLLGVMQREINETFPKALPSFRQNTSPNRLFYIHIFNYMQKDMVRQVTKSATFLLSFPLHHSFASLSLSSVTLDRPNKITKILKIIA